MLYMNLSKSALAASGGVMGGDSFSSGSSSGSSSSSYDSSSYNLCYSYSNSHSDSDSYSNSHSHSDSQVDTKTVLLIVGVGVLLFLVLWYSSLERITVLKLQVGLSGSARSLQKDLDQIAETADTSTSKGLNYVLTETISALSRHPEYWIAAYSSGDTMIGTSGGERKFKDLSREERAKFDEETLVNLNNVKRRSSETKRLSKVCDGYIVVTILMAADDKHVLPTINGESDLKTALTKLGSIASSGTKAVQVLWTPQEEDDVLSEQELLEKYFLLRPFE